MQRRFNIIIIILILASSSFIFPLNMLLDKNLKQYQDYDEKFIYSSAQTVYNSEWLDNNDFSTQAEWYYTKGSDGDNSSVDANISNGLGNYRIVGENDSFNILAGEVNSSTWFGWDIYNNGDYLLPDVTEINSTGCYVYHYLDEGESGSSGQIHNFPSVHFRKNVSLPVDISDYEIISASLEVIFNATVDSNVDVPGDSVDQSAIWDSATFYVEIADLNLSYAFRVAENKTSDLGQDFPSILTISDQNLTYVSESDLITALNLALEKDPNNSNFTIIMGLDIYCEDNIFTGVGDLDLWKALIFKSFNLTFEYERKADKFSSISWNQIGNQISGSNIQISQANLKFKVMIDQPWPTVLSPFSEVRILINDNPYSETVSLSSVNTTLQDVKVGGFDVTNLIVKDVNITFSLQLFIANTFSLGQNITFSIDDVYLNITYIETFPDYGTTSQFFLNYEDKTMDPYIQLPLNNDLNITIKYLDNLTSSHIDEALVTLGGKIEGILEEDLVNEQYSININTSDLDIGLWPLMVIAQKSNYQTQSIPFYVYVVERPTQFRLFVENDEKTNNNTVKVKYDELMNITVYYKDNASKQHLSGANVSITDIGGLNETNEQYERTINSNSLGLGFKVLIINARLENYTTQTFQLYVEVFERATELELYVNDTQRWGSDIIQVEINKNLNLTIYYTDGLLMNHINGASVRLLGIGNFTEISNQYNYTLNTSLLSLGFNVLTIYAEFNNYETQSIQFYVEVFEIESEIVLLVNGTQKYEGNTVQVEVNQFLNVTVLYRNNLTKEHLSGATLQLIAWNFFSEMNNQYNFTIDTNDLEQGITILKIQANLTNYRTQNIKFYVEVTERPTEFELKINNTQRSKTDTIYAEVNQVLNITVYYRDNLTKNHLIGATITLIGIGNFTEINNQYNYSLNTNYLEHGISIITVFAYIDNFQPQTFQFYVEVSERPSKIELFLNNINQTTDPVFEIPITDILNITVRYTDNQTGNHISGGIVQLIDDGLTENFTEFITLNQYTLYLNTSNLKIGVNLLEITAQANNFKIKSLNLRITVNRISTSISTTSGDPYINIKPGENIILAIQLNNIDFGEVIRNANVTYRWAYGQGELEDPDGNGIYEVQLVNVPAGTYKVTITASAGDNFDFKTYEITLNVVAISGPDLTLLIYILMGAFGALIIGFIAYQKHYKYPQIVRKIRKIRKKIRKSKKVKPLEVNKRQDLIKSLFEDQKESSKLDFEKLEGKKNNIKST